MHSPYAKRLLKAGVTFSAQSASPADPLHSSLPPHPQLAPHAQHTPSSPWLGL